MLPSEEGRRERWLREASFFDARARVEAGVLAIDPRTLGRYSRPVLRRRFSMEFRLRLLRPLVGRSLLDVGCGDGRNAVLFAKLGAFVTGVDLSSGSIELARRRAEASGVAERTRFVCSPIETAELPEAEFDVVWCDGVLHHVLADLEPVLRRLAAWTRPDGLLVLQEPVNLAPPLRRLRALVPVHTEATEDERPLEAAELALVRRYLNPARLRHFGLLGRLERFVLPDFNYEAAASWRRGLASLLGLFDFALLSIPGAARLGGTCVIYGPPNTRLQPLPAQRGAARP